MLKAIMDRVDLRRLMGGLFPILNWSKTYDVETAVGDFIAGLTVALTLIPQAIAYAALAGLEPQFGLYASLIGGFVYAVMGTCPQINIGPTALLSLLTFTYTNQTSTDFAVLLCFIAGIAQLIAGVARLGFLVEFISLPVISGFTSAAALTIASSQIKGLLGLKFNAETFITTWHGVYQHIGHTKLSDCLLGFSCCIVLIGMKALKDIRVKDGQDDKGRRSAYILKKTYWFLALSSNAIVVIAASLIAYFIHINKNDPLILTGTITPGLPTPQFPPFETRVGNTTYTAGDMVGHLGLGMLIVPVIGIVANVAIAKAFSNGKTVDATQEIMALGACNIVGAFFSSYPVNGSLSRSAVSNASGVRTPAAGIYTGIIVFLTLVLLTPYFYFIPRAALAAVIVYAVLSMMDFTIVKKLWNTSRLDIIPLVGTFFLCLGLGIEVGFVCGVAIDVLLLLYYQSRPPLDVQFVDDGNLPPHYVINPAGGFYFAGAESVRAKLVALKNLPNPNQPIPAPETLTILPDSEVLTNRNVALTGNNNVEMSNGRENGNAVNNQEVPGISGAQSGNTVDISGNNLVTRNVGVGSGDIRIISIENSGRRSANILLICCGALYRMDYTFLQSVKMLVMDWSRSGYVVWCDAKPVIKEQLDSVLHDPLYCDSDNLETFLTNLTVVNEQRQGVERDTHL